jgi:hypothetical protein
MDQATLTSLSPDLRNDLSATPIDGNWTYLGTLALLEGGGNGNHDIYMHIERKVLGCISHANATYLPHRLWPAHMSSSWVRAAVLHLAHAGTEALVAQRASAREDRANKDG